MDLHWLWCSVELQRSRLRFVVCLSSQRTWQNTNYQRNANFQICSKNWWGHKDPVEFSVTQVYTLKLQKTTAKYSTGILALIYFFIVTDYWKAYIAVGVLRSFLDNYGDWKINFGIESFFIMCPSEGKMMINDKRFLYVKSQNRYFLAYDHP